MNMRALLICLAFFLVQSQEISAQDQTTNISIDCADGVPGDTRCVSFVLTEAVSQATSIQFDISYDPNVLAYTGIPGFTGTCLNGLSVNEFNNNNNGIISFLWYQTPAIDLPAGCVMFTLCFNLIGEPGESSPVTILNNGNIEFASEFGNVKLSYTPCNITINPADFSIVKYYCVPTVNGASDGSISFYGIGGTAPYSYNVLKGAVSIASGSNAGEKELITIPNVSGGNYNIIVTDADGHVRNVPFFIDPSGQPTFDSKFYHPSCFSRPDGKIALQNINALFAPYSVKWSNGVFNQDSIQDLRNGTYSVSVTDVNGCAISKTFNLFADTLRAQFEILDSASCKGLKDGVVRISASGGTPNPGPQGYQVNLDQTSPNNFISVGNPYTWTNAPAGLITVRVRDYAINFYGNSNPCIIEQQLFVPYKNATEFTLVNKEDVACFGESTGKVEVKAGGSGVGTSFIMNTYYAGTSTPHPGGISGPMGIHLNNTLAAGDYCIYSRSNIGCRDTFCFTINQPFSKFVVEVDKTDPSCMGLGSIQLRPSGGEPSYTYKWSDDATAQDVRTNLNKGTYTVTVSDNVMCDTVITVSLENAPGTDSVKAAVLKAISCKDGNDGAVIVNFVGAVPTNATYSWEKVGVGPVGSTRSITGLSWGTYRVTVTVDGCVSIASVPLLNPDGLSITGVELIAPECPRGGFTGSVGITATGGAPSYAYRWTLVSNPNQVLGTNSVLAPAEPGTYQVRLTDQSGCTKDTTLVLPSPPDFTLTVSNIIAESCNGKEDGKATALAGGGPVNDGRYKFFWSSGEMSGGIFNPHSATRLAGGKNWVFVTDAKCVSDTVFFDVNSPPAINASYQTSGICAGSCTGRIDVTATGGTGGALSVSWPTVPFNGNTVFNLCAGSYPFVVTDGNGCAIKDTVLISAVDTVKVAIDSTLTIPLSCKTSIGQLGLLASGGTPIPGVGYNFVWSPNVSQSNLATNLDQGIYRITVSDQNGCKASISYSMERPNPISAKVAVPEAPNCFGGTTCIKVSEVTGGVAGNYTMQINNGLRIPIDSCLQLFAGEYLVSIFDASGCKVDYPATITQPDPIVLELGDDREINLGEEVGIITPFIESDFAIVNYQWSGLGDLTCIGDPCTEVAGTPKTDLLIRLVVTNENGCTAGDEVNVLVKDERRVYLPNIFLPSGNEGNKLFDIRTGYGVINVESFYIYDRWGNVVYSNFNYIPDASTGWDGLFRGQQALPGVYVYTATVKFLDGQMKTYRGDVTLFR